MRILLYILASVVQLSLSVMYVAMLLRVILELFADRENNRLLMFLVMVTELLVAPVRSFMMRFRFVQESPIDISYLVAWILLSVVSSVLPTPTL